MNWLRLKAKRLSLLAMFALALQFGLSFGHTHPIVAAAGLSDLAQPASPPDTDHDQDAHRDLCAVCATMAMANTLVAATPPSFPAMTTVATLQTTSRAESIAPEFPRGAFRSRAPPRS